jgi:hypothetical protein
MKILAINQYFLKLILPNSTEVNACNYTDHHDKIDLNYYYPNLFTFENLELLKGREGLSIDLNLAPLIELFRPIIKEDNMSVDNLEIPLSSQQKM